MIKKLVVVAFFSVSVLFFVGCASSPDDGTLVLSLGAEPSMLNPILSTDSPSSSVNGYVFSGLLKVSPELELIPDLAQSYRVSEDGLEFIFTLKEQVTWHDGAPFTAEDVKFTYEKILDKTTNTVRRSDYIINGEPIKFIVLSKHELNLHLF